jgi:hypothetical protein
MSVPKITTRDFAKHIFKEPSHPIENPALLRLRTCGTKRPRVTIKEADDAALRMSGKMNEEFHSYRCPFCKFYHIGHISLKKRFKA